MTELQIYSMCKKLDLLLVNQQYGQHLECLSDKMPDNSQTVCLLMASPHGFSLRLKMQVLTKSAESIVHHKMTEMILKTFSTST